MGSATWHPLEDSCFISSTGKIDGKVERFSNHSFAAWEVDVPADKKKSDLSRFADDFHIFFSLNSMTHLQLHARSATLPFHVCLCIEGLPMHAWTEQSVAHIVGRFCAVHYLEDYSWSGNYTQTYDLWTWCQDPERIPKMMWLTVANLDPVQGTINIPWVQAEPYDATVVGAKLENDWVDPMWLEANDNSHRFSSEQLLVLQEEDMQDPVVPL
ncbi:hypothetical protein ABZP36_015668 [Zizania latifolia]